MNNAMFTKQYFILRMLVWFQRSLRWWIRSIWLGAGGFLIIWGLKNDLNVFPDVSNLTHIILPFAIIPLLGMMVSWPSPRKFCWQLDRKFILHEQISTAYQVIHEGQNSIIATALVTDAAKQLHDIRGRIFQNKMIIFQEFLSIVIVGILVWLVYYSTKVITPIDTTYEKKQIESLPNITNEPTMGEIFKNGALGLPDPTDVRKKVIPDNLSAADQSLFMAFAQSLGDSLTGDAPTSDLGQALSEGDIQKAASSIIELSKNPNNISDQTKKNMSSAFEQNSKILEDSELSKLAQDLKSSSASLTSNNDENKTANDLINIAKDFNKISELLDKADQNSKSNDKSNEKGLQGGIGSGTGNLPGSHELGLPNEISRLTGGNDPFDLGQTNNDDVNLPGILMPGTVSQAGEQTALGISNQYISTNGESILTPLLPYYFSWRWKYAISSYFQPSQ